MDRIKEKLKNESAKRRINNYTKKNKNAREGNTQIINSIKHEKINWNNIRPENSKRIIDRIKEEYKKHHQPILDVSQIKEDYQLTLTDRSIQNPFIISTGLVSIIKKCTNDCQTKEQKARAIYDWIEQNIEYGEGNHNYSNSEEVIEEGRGICGEMSFVYITMARSIGLESALVEVDRDRKGKKVAHACAVVNVGNREIFVDPAYHCFDIQHEEYKILTDMDVLERFNQWRKGKSI